MNLFCLSLSPNFCSLLQLVPLAGEKTPALDRKGAKVAEGSSGRGKGTSPASDPSGVSVTVHPPAGEGNDGEQGEGRETETGGKAGLNSSSCLLTLLSLTLGLDSQAQADSGDSPVTEQPVAGEQPQVDDGAENER